jgi:hypothetical protein
MPDYRALIIGEEGHVINRVDLYCSNDALAKEWAEVLAGKHDVELWHRKEKIAVFKHETH